VLISGRGSRRRINSLNASVTSFEGSGRIVVARSARPTGSSVVSAITTTVPLPLMWNRSSIRNRRGPLMFTLTVDVQ